jgi:hypothetical protein
MASNLKADAIMMVAASQAGSTELAETVLGRYEDHRELVQALADVASVLSGTGPVKGAIVGYLDYIGAASNGKKVRGDS